MHPGFNFQACSLPFCLRVLLLAVLVTYSGISQENRIGFEEDIVRTLRYAAWEAGTVFGTAAAPYSRADLALVATRIRDAAAFTTLSRPALAVLELIPPQALRVLSDGVGLTDQVSRLVWPVSLQAAAELSLEAYPGSLAINPNDANSAFESIGSRPWGWADRLPALRIPIEATAFDFLYARVVLELKEEHNAIDRTAEPLDWSNWPESIDYIDYMFPFESFVALEHGPLSLSWGRDRLRWGPGSTGTLVLSDAPHYYDYLDAGLTGQTFAYRFAWISLEPKLLAGENLYWQAERKAWSQTHVAAKNLFLHRFEGLFFGRLALALTEGLMVGGIAPDLAFANPFLILHNRWTWNAAPFMAAASILGLEARLNPWRYLELYGSFAMNQYQTPYELSRFPDSADVMPNAYAWQLGLDGAYPLLGGWLTGTLEYVHTNPWMYIRENRLNSFSWRRYQASNVRGDKSIYIDTPIGYRHGPDARVLYLAFGWDNPGRLTLRADFEYRIAGEHSILTPYDQGQDAVALATPTGTPEYWTVAGLEAGWVAKPWLRIHAAVVYCHVRNAGHAEGILAEGLEGRLGLSLALPGFR
jgi:hypothetical protein